MFSQQCKLRKANLVPIHEKGDKQVINYRPVSLLLICGENFEKMIFNDTHGEAVFYSVQYKNGYLASSDLFHMFIHSIKFYILRVQIFEKYDSSNKQ